MASRWGVLVVHGVGDTGPGVTVDTFLTSLAAGRRVIPDGRVEVRWLRDASPAGRGAAEAGTFPVHVRHAKLEPPPAGASASGPEEAVFAEVYWADLSSIREGTFHLVLNLLSTVFSLRYITDQAAILPEPAEGASRAAWWAYGAARWLRALLHFAAILLCGPIAALSAFLAVAMAIDFLVLLPLKAEGVTREVGGLAHLDMLRLAAIAAVVGGLARLACTWRGSSSTWTRFWLWFGLEASAAALLLAARLDTDPAAPAWDWLKAPVQRQLGLPDVPLDVMSWFAAVILFAIRCGFALLALVMLAALLAWAFALICAASPWIGSVLRGAAEAERRTLLGSAPGRWLPALGAAYGAAIVQLGLWLLVVPPLAMIGVRSLLPAGAPAGDVDALMASVHGGFALHLAFTLGVALLALFVWLDRLSWARRQAWLRQPAAASFGYPTPRPDISRLIVNVAIVAAIAILGLLGSVKSLADFALRATSRPALFADELGWLTGSAAAGAFSSVFISVLLSASVLLVRGLREWLHIITDITNHFYRRQDAYPSPRGKPKEVGVFEFETQQEIEHRFKAALGELLDDPEVARLSVVSHSQGTVIAVDVFSLTALDDEEKARLLPRLEALESFHLVTLGSPLTHLYQHYFPYRYPPLADPAWDGFKTTVRRWINVYRVDDYVGTFIEPDPGWASGVGGVPVLVNVPIGTGGHVRYWKDPAVFGLPELSGALPG